MPRFFVSRDQIENGVVTILGDDAHHISRSLRMAAGEQITVCDMQSREYLCVLENFCPDRVLARVESESESDTEPPFEAHLYQALPKGEKLDSIIQKSVECGVTSITTFMSERCIAKEKGDEENKLRRRNKIALEAAKQSGRGIVPPVNPTVSFREMLERAAEADLSIFCYEDEDARSLRGVLDAFVSTQAYGEMFHALSEARPGAVSEIVNGEDRGDFTAEETARFAEAFSGKKKVPTIAIVIGSEGGFSPDEAERARDAGLITVGLGKRILRTETASSFVLGCLCYALEL